MQISVYKIGWATPANDGRPDAGDFTLMGRVYKPPLLKPAHAESAGFAMNVFQMVSLQQPNFRDIQAHFTQEIWPLDLGMREL
ncbi:MAG: hypothetical protein IPI20_06575 [Rhodoferax sp.]|nr:hypothetical protein [Rhodoferax sp.]